MALRLIILIALTTCIVLCAADSQATLDSKVSSSVSSASSEGSSSGKTNCVKVKKCPKNEEFSYCTQSISRAQYCSQKGQMLRQQEDNTTCKEGCVCKDGFLRNYKGKCISANKCNATCGPNEVLNKCPVDCASDYCPTSEQESTKCVKPKDDECPEPVCKCAFNYRRADNGTCIPTQDCPPFSCSARPNEQYTSCPPICPSDACGEPRLKGECPYRIGIRLECNPKCQCKDGYGRSKGICVPFADCPDLCSKNEEYSPCTQAVCRQQNCSNKDDPVACPAISEESCIRGCVCKQNYYRNANGTCVASDQCEDSKCANPHEVYSESTRIPNCPDLGTCKSIVARIICEEEETSGCICEGGYYRLNRTSSCIPACECPEIANTPECQK